MPTLVLKVHLKNSTVLAMGDSAQLVLKLLASTDSHGDTRTLTLAMCAQHSGMVERGTVSTGMLQGWAAHQAEYSGWS